MESSLVTMNKAFQKEPGKLCANISNMSDTKTQTDYVSINRNSAKNIET